LRAKAPRYLGFAQNIIDTAGLIYSWQVPYTATSLDGFIADEENSLSWLLQFGELEDSSYSGFINSVGAIAMGSTTYEWILTHQINEQAQHQQRWVYEQPTWVFTTRVLPTVEGADIRFVKGDVRSIHQEMIEAAGNKNIWLMGGGDLVGQFHDHGLLDEVIVQIASVTLGSGASLLPRKIVTPPLKLLSAKVYGNAFAELHYEVSR
jgi:dihydrofolate reductase